MELTLASSRARFLDAPFITNQPAETRRRSCVGDFRETTVESEANEWRTYHTRFLIRARQLKKAMMFVDPLGRWQQGKRGDYLVESEIGVRCIIARHVFEDLYVAMDADSTSDRPLHVPATRSSAKISRQPAKVAAPSVQNRRSSPASQPLIA